MAYKVDENGNYQRTVRCGHCYEIGHNKSSCPKRKQDLKDNIARYTKELEEDNFSESWYKENTERYLANSKQQLEKMTQKGKKRSCGYCHEVGHTRRTCPTRKTEVEEYSRRLMIARTKMADNLTSEGIFVGALIQTNREKIPAVITKIALNDVGLSDVIKEEHFTTRSTVFYEFITPQTNSWGQTKTGGWCALPPEILNVKGIPKQKWYRDNSQHSFAVLSNVYVPDGAYDDALDYKKVQEFATDVIDPR